MTSRILLHITLRLDEGFTGDKTDYSGTLRKVTILLDGEENVLYFIDPVPFVPVR